jgi:hypothetical protein
MIAKIAGIEKQTYRGSTRMTRIKGKNTTDFR